MVEGESVVRKTVLQMWAEANEQVETLTPAELVEELEAGDVLLLDVRLPTEIERRGRIEGRFTSQNRNEAA